MRHGKTDANQKDIISQLRQVGVWVCDLSGAGSGVPDLLVCWRGAYVLIELKVESAANITKFQMSFLGDCKGLVGIAESFEEAERLAKQPHIYCLTQTQKDKIAVYAERFDKKMMSYQKFKREVLEG